jgi:acetyl esterase/lipase
MQKLCIAVMSAACVGIASAPQANSQQAPQTSFEVEVEIPEIIPLWEGHAPGALGDEDRDKPTLTIYLPRSSTTNGTAIVVAPGGGYGHLDSNHEGRQVANWLNALGITAFVLKYRLGPRYHHPVELGDAQRALRLVRSRAQEFHIRSNRVGMMGFSAGGHLASTAATHFDDGDPSAADPVDRVSCRPDFLVLGYPVISFTAPYTHQGSVTNLLGENPDPKLREELSNELQVKPQTPPTFLFTTSGDTAVLAENSFAFYLALRKAGVPAEMHIFESDLHSVGLALNDPALDEWPTLLANWLRGKGLLDK